MKLEYITARGLYSEYQEMLSLIAGGLLIENMIKVEQDGLTQKISVGLRELTVKNTFTHILDVIDERNSIVLISIPFICENKDELDATANTLADKVKEKVLFILKEAKEEHYNE